MEQGEPYCISNRVLALQLSFIRLLPQFGSPDRAAGFHCYSPLSLAVSILVVYFPWLD